MAMRDLVCCGNVAQSTNNYNTRGCTVEKRGTGQYTIHLTAAQAVSAGSYILDFCPAMAPSTLIPQQQVTPISQYVAASGDINIDIWAGDGSALPTLTDYDFTFSLYRLG